jgi:hypothetical protein
MGGESDISLADDDADVMTLLVNSRLDIAESLFTQAAYDDAVVAYEAALALAPDNEAASEGLKQSRLYAANPPAEPAAPAAPAEPVDEPKSEEPQVLNNLLRSHLEGLEADDGPDATDPAVLSEDEMDVEFHQQGSIGILFEVSFLGTLPPSQGSVA